tara:strand:- start:1712 stop:2650 length:939 start_codon:yes stop_codon:yes gene_type:complete
MAAVTAIVAGGAAIASGAIGAAAAGRAARKAGSAAARAEKRVKDVERGRASIINPYSHVSSTSHLAENVSDMASNPYANLGVATQAAEMQAEEADIALANTLDTIRSSGASAGGATALAQAALKSKKGIAAGIEQQEVNNEKLMAQGEAKLQDIKMSEAQRMQMIEMSEAQRLQAATAQGRAYEFEAKENRDASDLARYSATAQNARQRQADANAAKTSAITGAIGQIGSIAMMGGGGPPASDRRLKENIKLIGYSPSGLKIYNFEYINKAFGQGIFQGVMSDEIPMGAVIKNKDGYDRVDYSKIDVEFKQI